MRLVARIQRGFCFGGLKDRWLARLDQILCALNVLPKLLISLFLNGFRESWIRTIGAIRWENAPNVEGLFHGLRVFKVTFKEVDERAAQCVQRVVMEQVRHLVQLQFGVLELDPASLMIPFYAVAFMRCRRVDGAVSMPTQKALLRILTLARVQTTTLQLQDLFELLAPSLKELKLEDLLLHSGSWTSMWRTMAKTLRFRRLELYNKFRGPSEEWTVVSWICATHHTLSSLTEILSADLGPR